MPLRPCRLLVLVAALLGLATPDAYARGHGQAKTHRPYRAPEPARIHLPSPYQRLRDARAAEAPAPSIPPSQARPVKARPGR
jgi:hypothetical protein